MRGRGGVHFTEGHADAWRPATAIEPPETLCLTPFLEPQDPDYPESPLFVAGFKNAEGEPTPKVRANPCSACAGSSASS